MTLIPTLFINWAVFVVATVVGTRGELVLCMSMRDPSLCFLCVSEEQVGPDGSALDCHERPFPA